MKGELVAMYNRMRRIFVALGVALPLIVVVPASHAEVFFGGQGSVLCYIDPATNTPYVYVYPPSVINHSANNFLLWFAEVRYWHTDLKYTGYSNVTDKIYFAPQLNGGQWYDMKNGLNYVVFSVGIINVYVEVRHYVFDFGDWRWFAPNQNTPPFAAGPWCYMRQSSNP
jgi:hypothetical protein